ncbi:hypothetical protein [Bacillus sp. IBL03825]|uniref:hypothetical protein n=1 Tax=Bacillus sp. IBL03825 TaxID=2953580 RepID=UPI0021576A42|nr:hypothetical protein [Bacillus sp. IBL03825]MCR6850380.1 hypothetical protein [Bacillus sp. IBL03825]
MKKQANSFDILVNERNILKDIKAWRNLAELVNLQSESTLITNALSNIIKDLTEHAIPISLFKAIQKGLLLNEWDDAVESFNLQKKRPINFYLGPMRMMESQPSSLGFILTMAKQEANDIVNSVEFYASEIGTRIFGFPCHFHGRNVEFYDIILAAGPFANTEGKYIALFTPFYLDGWKDTYRQISGRRSILFHNLIKIRFNTLTKPIAADHLQIDNKSPNFLSATEEEIDKAIVLWLTLHELIHGSGPLPLFQGAISKLSLGLCYAGIEEMRVDMTVWLLLGQCHDLFGHIAEIARHIILAERLLRSARSGLWSNPKSGWIQKSSDGEHGALWLTLLLKGGAIQKKDEQHLVINVEQVDTLLREILQQLYIVETQVANNSSLGQNQLIKFANSLRERLFSSSNGNFEYPLKALTILNEFKKYPTHIDLRFLIK